MSEIRIHQSLNHPNIVSFDHFFEDATSIYILLGICRNQTMHDLLARRYRLTEIEARCYLTQLIAGLKYLHKQHVIHRDLKLRNLFLTEKMELKIGDFGLAARLRFTGDKRYTVCGTPNYIAPEIIASKLGHSYEVDIWAIGIILYTILIGRSPFETPEIKSTYERIQSGIYTFPKEVTISEEAKDLIKLILNLDPMKRPSLEQILEHKFIAGYSTPALMPVSTMTSPPSELLIRKYSSCTKSIKLLLMNDDVSINPKQFSLTCRSNCHDYPTLKETISGIWVKQWADYSSKYGIIYLMSNGCYGAYYNDSTKLLLHFNQQYTFAFHT